MTYSNDSGRNSIGDYKQNLFSGKLASSTLNPMLIRGDRNKASGKTQKMMNSTTGGFASLTSGDMGITSDAQTRFNSKKVQKRSREIPLLSINQSDAILRFS